MHKRTHSHKHESTHTNALQLVCALHIITRRTDYTANETGNHPADLSFMCVDLSLAIKTHLILSGIALHC